MSFDSSETSCLKEKIHQARFTLLIEWLMDSLCCHPHQSCSLQPKLDKACVTSQDVMSTSLTGEESLMCASHQDSESVTDISGCEDVPELEPVSLSESKPRVNSLFLPENSDWAGFPYQEQYVVEPLSPLLAEETFLYLSTHMLGTDRAEQMSRASSDLDLVTHLLAERDRDLELAARVGQALLKRNQVLSEQNESLKEQLEGAFDRIHQLQHELSRKNELLHIVSCASEESETEFSCPMPLRGDGSFNSSQGLLQSDMLQEKLKELEEENVTLRSQACHLQTEMTTYEEKEQQLVHDCVEELHEANLQMSRMTEELSGKSDELIQCQEDISSLFSQFVDLQHKLQEHVIEKEELTLRLQESKDAQRWLTRELQELQDRNVECLEMLHESQEEIKELRRRSGPAAHLDFQGLSLAAEIEGIMCQELSLDNEKSIFKQKQVFDTVMAANDIQGRPIWYPTLLPIPGSNCSSVIMTAKPFESGLQQAEDRIWNQGDPTTKNPENPLKEDQRGPCGDSDLATALHLLSLQPQNYLSRKWILAEKWERKPQGLVEKKVEGVSGGGIPAESLASVYTSQSEIPDLSAVSRLRGFRSEKLQLLKPLEGSQILRHWQQLAQPSLATILDPRPGVITKDFDQLPKDTIYHLSDIEEDEEEEITFQVPQPLQVEQIPSAARPGTEIFQPLTTSAGGSP